MGVRRHSHCPRGVLVAGLDDHVVVTESCRDDLEGLGDDQGKVVGTDRAPEDGSVGGVGLERPEHGLAAAESEHVRTVGSHQRRGAGAVVAGRQHQVGPAADDREGPPPELALGELGRARDLVGHGGCGDHEGVAVSVDRPA